MNSPSTTWQPTPSQGRVEWCTHRAVVAVTLASLLALAGAQSARAATYYWDDDGAIAGFGTAGANTGTWAAPTAGPTAGWSLSAAGTNAFASFTTATTDVLNFGNGTTGLGAGTISVGTVSAGNMIFASGSGAIDLSGGTITLAAAQITTVNNTTNTIGSVLAGAGTSFNKAGTGTLVLTGNNTYTGATNVNGGTLTLNGTHSAAAHFTVNNGGTVNVSGTETINGASIALTLTGTSALNVQSGGVLNYSPSNGANFFVIGQGPATSIVTVLSGGTINVTTGGFAVGNGLTGNGTLTLESGSTMTLDNTTPGAGGFIIGRSVAVGTVNLNGGTLTTGRNITSGGNSTFNFNGGTLAPGLTSATFMTGLTRANVRNGGAIVNTAGFDITIGQALLHSNIGGDNATDGGLTKNGANTLTLSGANTYTGGTTVNAGTLTMGSASALGSTSGPLTVNGGTLNMGAQNLTVGNFTGTGGTISGTSGARTFTIGEGNGTGGNFQGVIANGASGTTALTKTGTGIITLSGNNTYTGATAVNGGSLLVNGSTAATSALTVGLSGTLGGNGTINGATIVNGVLTPGNSPGVLSFNSTLTLNGNTTLEIDGLNRGTEFDGVNTLGLLTYGGGLTLDFGTTLSGNQTFDLFNIGAGSQTGNFTSVALTGNYTGSLTNNGSGVWSLTDGGNTWSFSQATGDLTFIAVPEPTTLALLASGVAFLGLRSARRRRS